MRQMNVVMSVPIIDDGRKEEEDIIVINVVIEG